jgi:hypothetical protein
LKVQFDAVSGRIVEKYLTLSGQRHVVNVMFNSMSLQLRGSGRKICAREGDRPVALDPPPDCSD